MLRKSYRLRDSTRIKQVRLSGQSWSNRWLVLVKCTNGQSESRFAVSVSRRIGNAVARNRIKRLVREAIRVRLPAIRGGWDVVIIARLPARQARFSQIDRAVTDLLARSDLWSESGPVLPAANG